MGLDRLRGEGEIGGVEWSEEETSEVGHGKGDRASVLVFCETDVTIQVLIEVTRYIMGSDLFCVHQQFVKRALGRLVLPPEFAHLPLL